MRYTVLYRPEAALATTAVHVFICDATSEEDAMAQYHAAVQAPLLQTLIDVSTKHPSTLLYEYYTRRLAEVPQLELARDLAYLRRLRAVLEQECADLDATSEAVAQLVAALCTHWIETLSVDAPLNATVAQTMQAVHMLLTGWEEQLRDRERIGSPEV